MTVALLHKPI